MNKTTVSKMIFGAVLLLFTACSQDELAEQGCTLPDGEYPLQIGSVTLDVESSAEPCSEERPQTRVAENDNGTGSVWQWDGSEMIGVRLGDETTTYTLNADKTLTTDQQLYWTSAAPATVTAWYPTDESVDLSDQSEGLAYMLKAEVPGATYNNEIALDFKHQLAKVRVVLSGPQASLAQSVEVYGCTTCTNNEGAPIAGDTQGWLKMKHTTYTDGTECWEANVVPATITLDNFVRINGQTATVNDGFPTTLDASTMYTIDLTVGGPKQIFGGETITKPGEYIVKGTVTESITLDSEDITLILEGADVNTNGIAINIVSGNPTLKIQGTENAVKSATSTAIHVGSGCTLTIEGVNGMTDKLEAEGGKNEGTVYGSGNAGAGIGSSNGGNIVIRNVTIEAKGNTYSHFTGHLSGGSAAIGSSVPGYCGDITIDNATVTATGGYWAAAIGMSGCVSDSYYPDLKIEKIHISHSVITAQGGDGASAIGLAWMEDLFLSSAYAGEIYIETDETSTAFLGRLTSSGNFKIGKGKHYSDRMTFYNQDGSGTWPGVTLKASDGTRTSPDGIGQ
jgi:hypothetical protein